MLGIENIIYLQQVKIPKKFVQLAVPNKLENGSLNRIQRLSTAGSNLSIDIGRVVTEGIAAGSLSG